MLPIQQKLTNTFYALLALPATAMGFALSVQISALSWILSTQYNLDIHDVGLVWAAGPLAGIIGQVIIGVVSDNVWFWNGRRRPFILIGGVLASLMLFALPSIDIISSSMGFEGILGVAMAVAIALDLSINISFNPTRSIIADVTPEGKERTKGYTWMQTISGSFGVMAYGIGAIWDNYILIYSGVVLVFLFSFIPPFFIKEPKQLPGQSESSESHSNFSLTEILVNIRPLWGFLIYDVYAMTLRLTHLEVPGYYVELICIILTGILVAQALMKKEDGLSKEEAGAIGFKKVLAAHSFSWIGVQTMFVYMFAYLNDKLPQLSEIEMGRVISISFLVLNLVGALLPAFVLEPITEKIGRVKTHMYCMVIMAIGYFAIVLAGVTPLMIYIFMAICGVGWAAIVSLPFAIMSQKVDQSKMGLYMGLFNLSVVLPQLLASLGVGQAISQAENKSLIFIICGVSLALSSVSWMMVKEGDSTAKVEVTSGGGH